MTSIPLGTSRRLAVALVATVFALITCEVAARGVFPAPPGTHLPQIVYRSDSDIRYVLAANQRGWIDDGFVATNSLGFRGREVEVPKPAGRVRVVAIGDSITFGWGVNDDDTFCSRIERLLRDQVPARDLDVVNLSVGGYDTRQEVGLLKRNLQRLEPDVVLVGFYSNDVPESLGDRTTLTAEHGDAPGPILHLNPVPSSWWDVQMRKSRAIYTVGRLVKRLNHQGEWGSSGFSMELDMLAGRESSALNAAWDRVTIQLKDLADLARSHHFAVAVVVLPPREQVMGQYPDASYQHKIGAIAGNLGFTVIDPLPAMVAQRAAPDGLFIPYDRNHPSRAGHLVLAQAIAAHLKELPMIAHAGAGTGALHRAAADGETP